MAAATAICLPICSSGFLRSGSACAVMLGCFLACLRLEGGMSAGCFLPQGPLSLFWASRKLLHSVSPGGVSERTPSVFPIFQALSRVWGPPGRLTVALLLNYGCVWPAGRTEKHPKPSTVTHHQHGTSRDNFSARHMTHTVLYPPPGSVMDHALAPYILPSA